MTPETPPKRRTTRWIKILILIVVAFVLGILLTREDGPCKPSPPPEEPVPACKPGEPCPVGQPEKPEPKPETPGSGSSGSSTAVPGEDASSSG